jgi:hypothetical protein
VSLLDSPESHPGDADLLRLFLDGEAVGVAVEAHEGAEARCRRRGHQSGTRRERRSFSRSSTLTS